MQPLFHERATNISLTFTQNQSSSQKASESRDLQEFSPRTFNSFQKGCFDHVPRLTTDQGTTCTVPYQNYSCSESYDFDKFIGTFTKSRRLLVQYRHKLERGSFL